MWKRRSSQQTEERYRRGAAQWAERDLDGAVATLTQALEASRGPRDSWWFAVGRALAQIAMETDDLDAAGQHLQLSPGDPVGDAQQAALRAMLALLRGDEETASLQVALAVARLDPSGDTDVGSLMNGAIALAWCADVAVEVGFADVADRMVKAARQRTAEAGVEDSAISGMLTMVEAQAACLRGDPGCERLVALVDAAASPDFAVKIERERARAAGRDGDRETAADRYAAAASNARRAGYRSLARRIDAERTIGPPRSRPVEDFRDLCAAGSRRAGEDVAPGAG